MAFTILLLVAMSLIRIFTMTEIESISEEYFDKGHPSRCMEEAQFGAREMYLNVAEIVIRCVTNKLKSRQ